MKYVKYALIGAATGFLNGFFGAGGGSLAVPAMEHILGLEKHKAHATAIGVILPLTIVSAIFYIMSGNINWHFAWQASLGGVIGGILGARLLKKLSANWLSKLFGAVLIFLAVKMII